MLLWAERRNYRLLVFIVSQLNLDTFWFQNDIGINLSILIKYRNDFGALNICFIFSSILDKGFRESELNPPSCLIVYNRKFIVK